MAASPHHWLCANAPIGLSIASAHLFHQDGEPLVLEGFGELDVLGTLIVDGQGGHDHVGQTPQQLPHHPVPLLLVAVVDLRGSRGVGPVRLGATLVGAQQQDSLQNKTSAAAGLEPTTSVHEQTALSILVLLSSYIYLSFPVIGL